MTDTWDARIGAFWEAADDSDSERTLAAMRRLVAERPAKDPDATYEWASVHDFLGLEEQAIPLYEAALAAGLTGDRRPQALIQLASSLRNVGRAAEAVAVLRDLGDRSNPVVGAAAQAFLALALHDLGEPDEALRVALLALAPTLPLYARAVTAYAEELTEDRAAQEGAP